MARRIGTVLIGTGHEGHGRTDRHMAARAGATQVVSLDSGEAVLAHLAKHGADLVLCDSRLADMSGVELVRLLRSDPRFAGVPVVMAARESSRLDILDAIGAGCHGYVVRPYSQEALARQMRLAVRNARTPDVSAMLLARARAMRSAAAASRRAVREGAEGALVPLDAGAAARAATPASLARAALESGMGHLVAGRYNSAIAAFHKALGINAASAEAYEGLGRAWLGKGRRDKYTEYMDKAARCLAEQDRFLDVRSLLSEVLKQGGRIANPYYELGKLLWEREDQPEAVLAWRKAARLTPDSRPVVTCLARAYCILGQEDRAEAVLAEAKNFIPDVGDVAELTCSLPATVPPPAVVEVNLHSWLRLVVEPVKRVMAHFRPAPERAA
ncbi:response regulator receiver protein [Desulfovibrio sp. X2]|uniref:response regulator n=1 Tax=Desulfovibrio sp. X2 TaxID=941449 RepID=UPI0003588BDB|nr:response regulator [Desulfovibrio sp. X2]EPR44558.1 response regulator receiver protein [Desulfovibrio sp. X2]